MTDGELNQRIEGDIAQTVGDLTVKNIIITNQLRQANAEASQMGAMITELNARIAKLEAAVKDVPVADGLTG